MTALEIHTLVMINVKKTPPNIEMLIIKRWSSSVVFIGGEGGGGEEGEEEELVTSVRGFSVGF
jgi:hypothetical protein